MKSPLRSIILIASLTVNVALVAVVLVHFLGPRDEPAAPPAPDATPRHATESLSAAPHVAAAALAPEAISSSLPAPGGSPISQPAVAPLPAPPAVPAAPRVAALSFSTPSRAAQSVVSSGIPSSPSYQDQALQPAAAEDPSLGPASPVNSSAGGNFFISRGVRVAVAETYPTTREGGTPLGIDLSPAGAAPSENAAAAPSTSQTAAAATGGGNENSRSGSANGGNPAPISPGGNGPPPSDKVGLTENEEDLFRMKWGWAAFDAAQTEAKREADRAKNR